MTQEEIEQLNEIEQADAPQTSGRNVTQEEEVMLQGLVKAVPAYRENRTKRESKSRLMLGVILIALILGVAGFCRAGSISGKPEPVAEKGEHQAEALAVVEAHLEGDGSADALLARGVKLNTVDTGLDVIEHVDYFLTSTTAPQRENHVFLAKNPATGDLFTVTAVMQPVIGIYSGSGFETRTAYAVSVPTIATYEEEDLDFQGGATRLSNCSTQTGQNCLSQPDAGALTAINDFLGAYYTSTGTGTQLAAIVGGPASVTTYSVVDAFDFVEISSTYSGIQIGTNVAYRVGVDLRVAGTDSVITSELAVLVSTVNGISSVVDWTPPGFEELMTPYRLGQAS